MAAKKEKFRVWGNVFDDFTERTIFKLISEGHLEGLESPISIGKEANIFSAKKGPDRVIIKIYRLETCDFNRMYDYIKYDPRYPNLKKCKRQVILSWVQREFRNLMKAREAMVKVPAPLTIKNNVLVLEFIGKDHPAPRIKDLPPKNKRMFLKELTENLKKLYKAGLVHADLSPFNILNLNDHPVLIDFSQCCTLEHPRAKEFLERDIKNISIYFNKIGHKTSEKSIKEKILK